MLEELAQILGAYSSNPVKVPCDYIPSRKPDAPHIDLPNVEEV